MLHTKSLNAIDLIENNWLENYQAIYFPKRQKLCIGSMAYYFCIYQVTDLTELIKKLDVTVMNTNQNINSLII